MITMKKYFYMAVAAIAVLSSCSKEEAPVGDIKAGDTKSFSATIGEGVLTRTTLVDNYANWEKDIDKISINSVTYTATAVDGTKATFTQDADQSDPTGPTYNAYYPASLYECGTLKLPNVQTYTEGHISNLPMFATTTNTNLVFKNICGVLAVKVTSADIATLKSIRVSSSNHDMSGEFAVNASNEAVLSNDNNGTNMVELVSDEELTLDAEGTTFFIAIPANTYQNLKIELSSDGTDYTASMTSTVAGGVTVNRNKIYNLNFVDQNYLCFTATDSINVALNKEGDPETNTVEYSKDKSTWTPYTTYGTGIALTDDQKLYFRAKTDRKAAQDPDCHYVYFSITGDGTAEVSGNVMYLLNTDPGVSMYYEGDCASLFYNCDKLTKADRLLLPATSLTADCYHYMFNCCSSLSTAPALPATTLADGCYFSMFLECGLSTAPALQATELASRCYSHMFECSSLSTAPALPATTLADGCYESMFFCCSSLSTAPDLPATSLANNCYKNMFAHCYSLSTAPVLPATTLAGGCYESMFTDCMSFSTAPALPATTLADECYNSMFSSCSSLSTAPALPATTLAKGCYGSMFAGCPLSTAPVLPATILAEGCYESMFYRCSNLSSITCLATDISADDCTKEWVYEVPSGGTFIKAAGAEGWTTGDDGIPSGWTVVDYVP